jgi:hypothetical protein
VIASPITYIRTGSLDSWALVLYLFSNRLQLFDLMLQRVANPEQGLEARSFDTLIGAWQRWAGTVGSNVNRYYDEMPPD